MALRGHFKAFAINGLFRIKVFCNVGPHFMTKTIKRVKKCCSFFYLFDQKPTVDSIKCRWTSMFLKIYIGILGVHLQLIQTRNLKHNRTHSCVVYITTLSYLDTVMEILGDIILCQGQGSNPQSTDRRFLVRATYLARICISPINHFDPVGGQYSEEVCWGHLNYYCDH